MNGYAWDIQATSDGGWMVTGSTMCDGVGGHDLLLLKMDADGATVWMRTIGGGDFDSGISVTETTDGGYIATGYTYSFGVTMSDGYVVKTDSAGNVHWSKTFGGIYNEDLVAAQETPDGGYMIVGSTASFGTSNTDFDVYLIRTDSNGDTLWTRTYGGAGSDNALDLHQTPDSGFVVAGYTNSFGAGGDDAFLMKVDASGNLLWIKTYGGVEADVASDLLPTNDHGYLLVGKTHSFGAFSNDGDLYLVKTNANGDTIWSRAYGGAGSDWGYAAVQTADGGYTVCGYTYSFGAGAIDAYLVRTDSSGGLRWSKAYGGAGFDFGYGLTQTSDGSYALAGSTSSFSVNGAYLIKADADGESGCNVTAVSSSSIHPATQMNSANGNVKGTTILVTSPVDSVGGGCVLDVVCLTVGLPEISATQWTIYPNPAHRGATVEFENPNQEAFTLELYDLHGRLVQSHRTSTNQIKIMCDNLSGGLYSIVIYNDAGVRLSGKLVIE